MLRIILVIIVFIKTINASPTKIDNDTVKSDECIDNPCQNSGNCTVSEKRYDSLLNFCWPHHRILSFNDKASFLSYDCTCVPGFTGRNCEVNIDDCIGHECKNEASCKDGINNYTCNCDQGYTGNDCETSD